MVAKYFMMKKREDVYMGIQGWGKCDGMKIELAHHGLLLCESKVVSNLNRLLLILNLADSWSALNLKTTVSVPSTFE